MKTLQHKRGTAAILTANNPTIPAGEIVVETDTGRIKIGDGSTAWTALAYFVPASSDIVTAATLAARQHQTTALIDTVDRHSVGTSSGVTSGAVYWSFFTPIFSLTISQISVLSGNSAASSVTLARLGLYTADASGNATLVARSASDTSILTASGTVYTRSLDTTGGYPSTYTLSAGTRYAAAFIIVATSSGSVQSSLCAAAVAALSPRLQGVRTGNSDLVTSQTSAQYNGSISFVPWFRLS